MLSTLSNFLKIILLSPVWCQWAVIVTYQILQFISVAKVDCVLNLEFKELVQFK